MSRGVKKNGHAMMQGDYIMSSSAQAWKLMKQKRLNSWGLSMKVRGPVVVAGLLTLTAWKFANDRSYRLESLCLCFRFLIAQLSTNGLGNLESGSGSETR